MLASRYETLNDFANDVEIVYSNKKRNWFKRRVKSVALNYEHRGCVIKAELYEGVAQSDFVKSRDGGLMDRVHLIFKSPFAVANRRELNMVYMLSRRRPAYFGEGDVAFFDLALASVNNISTAQFAFVSARDSSEKGFLNTFNHTTSQALITSIFSEDLADFVGDVHERHNMPELITGQFKPEQLADTNNNPVDNYVDMINNQLGQRLALSLNEKYMLNAATIWTPELLAAYLNDLQNYYARSFKIRFRPFSAHDLIIQRFCKKIEVVRNGMPFKDEL